VPEARIQTLAAALERLGSISELQRAASNAGVRVAEAETATDSARADLDPHGAALDLSDLEYELERSHAIALTQMTIDQTAARLEALRSAAVEYEEAEEERLFCAHEEAVAQVKAWREASQAVEAHLRLYESRWAAVQTMREKQQSARDSLVEVRRARPGRICPHPDCPHEGVARDLEAKLAERLAEMGPPLKAAEEELAALGDREKRLLSQRRGELQGLEAVAGETSAALAECRERHRWSVQQQREVRRFIEGGDHDPDAVHHRVGPNTAVSLSVQSYSKYSTRTPPGSRASAWAAGA